jgi:hypothetical protein
VVSGRKREKSWFTAGKVKNRRAGHERSLSASALQG